MVGHPRSRSSTAPGSGQEGDRLRGKGLHPRHLRSSRSLLEMDRLSGQIHTDTQFYTEVQAFSNLLKSSLKDLYPLD